MRLTAKQALFVQEYLVDLNATQAAIRAGYSKRTAASIGDENLRKPVIADAIQAAQAERNARVEIDQDYVLQRLIEIDQMDVKDILTEQMEIKPISEWPRVWRQYLSGFDLSEMFDGRGDEREMTGILKKLKWPDKVRNLELLGRHVGVQAFRDRVEHTGKNGGPIETVSLSPEQAAKIAREYLLAQKPQ